MLIYYFSPYISFKYRFYSKIILAADRKSRKEHTAYGIQHYRMAAGITPAVLIAIFTIHLKSRIT